MRHRKEGLSVETAAARAGFSRATVYGIERESRLPYDNRIELYLGAKRYDVLARVRPGKGKRAGGVN